MPPLAIAARNARNARAAAIDAREEYMIARDASIRAQKIADDAYRNWANADLAADEAEADADLDSQPAS